MPQAIARVLTLLAVVGLAVSASSAEPGLTLPADMRGQTILYVGAHPDDEWGMVPILADACLDRGATCRFLVVSEAKSYGCLLTIGLRDPHECSRLRRAEMQRAVTMFKGTVEFLGMEDLARKALALWFEPRALELEEGARILEGVLLDTLNWRVRGTCSSVPFA